MLNFKQIVDILEERGYSILHYDASSVNPDSGFIEVGDNNADDYILNIEMVNGTFNSVFIGYDEGGHVELSSTRYTEATEENLDSILEEAEYSYGII